MHPTCKQSLGSSILRPPNSWLLQELGEPILSLDQGMKAGSYVQENGRPVQILRSTGDVSVGLQAAPHTITNARHVLFGCSFAAWMLSARCSPHINCTMACLLLSVPRFICCITHCSIYTLLVPVWSQKYRRALHSAGLAFACRARK